MEIKCPECGVVNEVDPKEASQSVAELKCTSCGKMLRARPLNPFEGGLTEALRPEVAGKTFFDRVKLYVFDNFEQLFVLAILVTVMIVNYLIVDKLAFLNFYFLPVLAAGYILGVRSALLGSVFCALMISFYAIVYPSNFMVPLTGFSLAFTIVTWGCFLILAGALTGSLNEKVKARLAELQELYQRVRQQYEELEVANAQLRDDGENLEQMVHERTRDLMEKNKAIEALRARLETALFSTMDPIVAKLIIEKQLSNEKRMISVLFSDVVGFTTLTEKKRPETIIDELNQFFNYMEPIITLYNGHLDKYIGDGIMAEFGAPIDCPNHALFATLSGLGMQRKLREMSHPWRMRVGISTGDSIIGMIGSERRQGYTVLGDMVNLASRLEEVCTPGSVFIDSGTYDGVRHTILAERVREVDDKVGRGPEDELEPYTQEYRERISENPHDVQALFELGKVSLEIGDISDGIDYFKRALAQPSDIEDEIRLQLGRAVGMDADAGKIKIRGKEQRVTAYKVIGIRDPMDNRDKFPQSFYDRYKDVRSLIPVSDNAVLPIEAIDATVGHSVGAAAIAYAIADRMALSEETKLLIARAAFLHDIGKKNVPHHLLNMPISSLGGLSKSDFAFISSHPLESSRIVMEMGEESGTALSEIIKYHHEWHDGGGYPTGRKGNEIPLESRIVAVADAYDSLTSRRPWRGPWERSAALQELERDVKRGKFDPAIVKILTQLITENGGS